LIASAPGARIAGEPSSALPGSHASDPMKPALFLSDLHLTPARPAALAAFHAFVRGPARAASAVYVLGDLFDWWIGDDQLRDDFVADIAQGLRTISDAGVPLYVARGNRDFLLGERFARTTGATILPERKLLELPGAPTLISHGDELCTDDLEYQRYRTWIRDPVHQRRILRVPYFLRRAAAAWLRRKSRDATALKPEHILDVSDDAVDEAFRNHAATRMIHGHTHRPARHERIVDGIARERYVLADWHDHGRYLEVDERGVREREISG
jgi:UDP-2,3-diacylglucosamine hydrolase